MLKRLISKIQPGHALLIGAILMVLGWGIGGVIGLSGAGFMRGAEIGLAAAPIVGLLALIIGAIVRAHITDKDDQK